MSLFEEKELRKSAWH